MDRPIEKLAKLIIHYSLKLKKGQLVKIQGEICTRPLMNALFEEAIAVGAHPYTKILIPEQEEALLKSAREHQLKYLSPVALYEVKNIDAYIGLWGSENTRYLSGIDPQRQATAQKYMRPILDKFFKRTGDGSLSWCGTLFPAQGEAQEAEMSLSEWEDFVFRAGHLQAKDPIAYWKKIAKEQHRLVRILNRTDRLHIRSDYADLKMRVKGRKWINCAGTENFPDGEIFTSPLEDSVEGYMSFSYPAVYRGREVDKVRLEFKRGRVVAESAGKNAEFLTSMLDIDKGARSVGEIAIGTNYDIKRFTKNILFDEKIGGTCHLAVGASIPEAGGKNKSAVHWDMICNMRSNAEISADGKVVYRNGKFVV